MSGKIWAATNVQCRYINAKQHSSVSDFDIYIIFNASLSVCFIFTTRIKTGCSILCPLIQHLLLENHSEKSKAARSVFVYLCIWNWRFILQRARPPQGVYFKSMQWWWWWWRRRWWWWRRWWWCWRSLGRKKCILRVCSQKSRSETLWSKFIEHSGGGADIVRSWQTLCRRSECGRAVWHCSHQEIGETVIPIGNCHWCLHWPFNCGVNNCQIICQRERSHLIYAQK